MSTLTSPTRKWHHSLNDMEPTWNCPCFAHWKRVWMGTPLCMNTWCFLRCPKALAWNTHMSSHIRIRPKNQKQQKVQVFVFYGWDHGFSYQKQQKAKSSSFMLEKDGFLGFDAPFVAPCAFDHNFPFIFLDVCVVQATINDIYDQIPTFHTWVFWSRLLLL